MKKKELKKYGEQRRQVRDNLEIHHLEISGGFIPGTRCVIATIPDMSFSVGTVWYTLVDAGTCSIETSYVEPWARRLKVRTRLNQWIIDAYPKLKRITTGQGISKASRRWMKKQGYVHKADRMVLRIKRQGKD